jgi:formate hydrogenlyase subunit 3/multisubunit Na+/H+ antiporter MnhD subunit
MLILMVFLPMIAALVCYPICRNSERAWFTPAIAVSGAVFVMGLLLVGDPELAESIDFFCGNGIYFKAGGLRTVMATLAGFMWVMTALASPEYFSGARANGRYFLFYLLFV